MRKNVNQLIIALLALLGLPLFGNAQNVTISPSSGQLIAAKTYEGEVGSQYGWSALWHHNQLALTLVVSDKGDLTASNRLKDPAGDISLDSSQGLYVVGGGSTASTHLNISLPKGYRFTGYRMVWLNNMNGKKINGVQYVSMSKTIYETGKDFDISNPLAYTPEMPSENDEEEYTIERTSKTPTDMTNQLYFLFDHESTGYYGATLKYCELYFTADATFETDLKPTSDDQLIADGKNMVLAPFYTDKLDLGPITPNKMSSGNTYLSYVYSNVKDLQAYNYLYQENAVTGDTLPAEASKGDIQVLKNSGDYYYAVGNNTYYVETPIRTFTQTNDTVPLGYRIVGATVTYNYGTKADATAKRYYITHTVSGLFGSSTYYLQPNASWDTDVVYWEYTADGKLKSGDYYLYVTSSGGNGRNRYYYLSYTTSETSASKFTLDETNGRVMYNSMYVYYYSSWGNTYARLTSDASSAATLGSEGSSNPAFTPAPYTLKVYSADGTSFQTVNVSESNPSGTITLDNLNNDAIKFSVEGLPEGAKALVQVSLKLETLNPFVNTLDIVCHSHVPNTPSLTQTFTSNDFQVVGGKFDFYVPSGFLGNTDETKKCYFTFENLFSKYGDEDGTYPTSDASSHHSRYFFVKSEYWNDVAGDGKQYQASGNEDYKTKSKTLYYGLVPYKYNNIDQLVNTNTSSETTSLKEFPFSEEKYKNQEADGTGGFYNNRELAPNDSDAYYLFTGDETRWNIAPTKAMEHRFFAYYELKIKLNVKDYTAKCKLTPLYTKTCYNGDGTYKDLPMYGGTFVAIDKETGNEMDAGQAWLTVPDMAASLTAALHEIDPSYSGKQVLYLDYTHLYSIYLPERAAMDSMKAKLNPNCLFYFPVTTPYNDNNFAQMQKSGNFRACANIVLTDKQPFFAPYNITVPAENYAQYTRQITVPKNGKVALATVMLPFTLETTDGLHTNRDSLCSFSMNTMKANGCISLTQEELETPQRFNQQMQFEPISGTSEANKPYMIKVEKAPADANISFIAQQYGSDVIATPSMNSDYTITGESATGTLGGDTYTFVNYGSYAGKKIALEGDSHEDVFYFSGGMYLNINNLHKELQYLYSNPFRAYYKYTSTAGSKSANGFNVSFSDPILTGIDTPLATQADLRVASGKGRLTITSTVSQDVRIISASGALVRRMDMQAGQTQTVLLPAGIYIINNTKIIVK